MKRKVMNLTDKKIVRNYRTTERRTVVMKDTLGKLLDITFWKFIWVGVINTLVGTAVMFLCYNLLHFGYWPSSAANYIVGSVVSYFLNKYFTFKDNSKSGKQILRFVVNITICYLIAYGAAKPFVLWVLKDSTKVIQDNLSMLVGMGLFVILNYLGQRLVVFKKDEKL